MTAREEARRQHHADMARERRRVKREQIQEQERRKAVWFAQWVRLLRVTQGCDDCGTHSGWLEHHHVDPTTKLYSVSSLQSRTIQVLLDEIDKCVVLCRSCHKKRHAELGRAS